MRMRVLSASASASGAYEPGSNRSDLFLIFLPFFYRRVVHRSFRKNIAQVPARARGVRVVHNPDSDSDLASESASDTDVDVDIDVGSGI